MATTEILTTATEYDINASNTKFILKNGSTITANASHGIFGGSGFTDDLVVVNGQISQTGFGFAGIRSDGADMSFQIGNTGSVLGYQGIELTGARNSLLNNGTVTGSNGDGVNFTGLRTAIVNNGEIFSNIAGGSAIGAYGMNSTITNNGRLQGSYGITVTDANVTIKLGADSIVRGTTAAIFSESTEPSERIKIVNDGMITTTKHGYAIETQDAKEIIVNHGTIKGQIQLGSGNDVFDNRGGILDHGVRGGAGDDTLIVNNAKHHLIENGGSEGYDTVKSTVSYVLSENVERLILLGQGNTNGKGTSNGDDLFGNSGNNKLSGLAGVDSLGGGKGNDLLIGGANADTFIFKTGFGHDTIMDFENGIDKIDLSKWSAISNFADLKAHHLSQSNGDVHITAGSDMLNLHDTKINQIDHSDFQF